jgi:hypothetical protein
MSPKERAAFIADCNRAAAFYEAKPGLAGWQAIIDLYASLAKFAALTDPDRPNLRRKRRARSATGSQS